MNKIETEETVIITRADYNKLRRNTDILTALYQAGVDSWDWYEDALSTVDFDRYNV